MPEVLQSPAQPVEAILVALEASPAVVAEAARRGAQLLLTHHPLLYRPLEDVREDRPGGRLLADLLRARLAMVSCHTNLDIAPGGLNDYLAQKLELTGVEVLTPTTRDRWYKLVVFVPAGYEDPVRQALGDAGLGVIGRYSHCSFASPGQGTYRPLPGARPFQGEVGELSRADESRLEILAPESLLPAALARLKENHPYEEPAYDIYSIENPYEDAGLGVVGTLTKPVSEEMFLETCQTVFGTGCIRHSPLLSRDIERVALWFGDTAMTSCPIKGEFEPVRSFFTDRDYRRFQRLL